MKPVKPLLAGLALLLFVSHARAESRVVLIQTKQDKDQKTSVTIYSAEKQEQKSAVSVEEAVKVIAGMKGWGSTVGVYVASDGKLPRAERKTLLAAIDGNVWLDLKYFGREVPKGVGDHFLKGEVESGKEPGPADRLADWPPDAPLQLRPRVGRASLGRQAAEQLARGYLGIDTAKELRLGPAYLTDHDFPFLRPEKRSVWLAEVRDLRLPGGGPKPVVLSHLYVAVDAETGQLVEAFTAPARPWWRENTVVGPAHEKFFRETGQVLEQPADAPKLSLTDVLRGISGDDGQGQIVVRYGLYSNRGQVPAAERRPALLVFREGLRVHTRGGEVSGRSVVVLDAETGASLSNQSYGNPKD